MQPRESYYAFVHQHLRDVALLASAQVWHVLTSPAAGAWLTSRWLAVGGQMDDAQYLGVVGQYRIGDSSVLLLTMPPPLFPTEAHLVALARDAAGNLRYFVMERAATGPLEPLRAFGSEWCVGGARVRYGDLPAITPQAFLALLTQELAPGSDPTTVSMPPPAPTQSPSIHPTSRTTRPAPLSSKRGSKSRPNNCSRP